MPRATEAESLNDAQSTVSPLYRIKRMDIRFPIYANNRI
ncbi:hypothetical protein BDD21_4546 [Thiocapsa rosea]|uniref:Uncharacterized protein n=1 Tax=Thiocapsa rosea TaxID=69360 RepID=A0A495VDX3_9GAMM|nr:hypothetical protein BDD21_4546 [Thiocapsa rosea]